MVVIAGLALRGSGGSVNVVSINSVPGQNSNHYPFEPASSTSSGNWVTSWMQIPYNSVVNDASYTSSTSSSSCTQPVQHTLSSQATGDLFLATHPNGSHMLVGVGSGSSNALQLFYKTSTDSTGQCWNTTVVPFSGSSIAFDYPSVAAGTDGTNTTVVIVYNSTNGLSVTGMSSIFSVNGGSFVGYCGNDGHQPCPITTSASQTLGRVVAVGNTFHVLVADLSDPTAVHLKRYQWNPNTLSWGSAAETSSFTYTAPNPSFPSSQSQVGNNINGNPNKGQTGYIDYAPVIDAQATSSGWVVLAPAARSDNSAVNNFVLCVNNLSTGCTSVNYASDLFLGGITTSSNSGDIWATMLTYTGSSSSTNYTLPLQQVASYCASSCTSSSSWISGSPNTPSNSNIDPTTWAYFPATSGSPKCPVISFTTQSCFAAGDWARPAMNTSTEAALPFVNVVSQTTPTLYKSLVNDPQSGLKAVEGLSFSHIQPSADLRFKGLMTTADVAWRTPTQRIRLMTAK